MYNKKVEPTAEMVLWYKKSHFSTIEGWLRKLNLDYAPIEVKEVRKIACYNSVRYDAVCNGVTLASFMKVNADKGYFNSYVLINLNRAVPQFERENGIGKVRKVGVCTTQILDFYWGGGIGKILSDKTPIKDLAVLNKRLTEGVNRFRRTLSLSIVACQLRGKENQFTPFEWDLIKSFNRNPAYALRRMSTWKKA